MTVQIGTSELGDGAPVYVIAEIGLNHNGSIDKAIQLIDVAADAGAQAVKFQKRSPVISEILHATSRYPLSAIRYPLSAARGRSEPAHHHHPSKSLPRCADRLLQSRVWAANLHCRSCPRRQRCRAPDHPRSHPVWGSDHASSLEPRGFEHLVRDIRIIGEALGDGVKRVFPGELTALAKLRRVPV